MADPTLEEQQAQTSVLLDIKHQLELQGTELSAQGVVIQAQASDLAALKSHVEGNQYAPWMTAFSVCLCFGAILFRIVTRSAASKRILGAFLAVSMLFSVPAFAANVLIENDFGMVIEPTTQVTNTLSFHCTPPNGSSPTFYAPVYFYFDGLSSTEQVTFTVNRYQMTEGGQVVPLDSVDYTVPGGNTTYTQYVVTSHDESTAYFDVIFYTNATDTSSNPSYSPPSLSCDSDSKYIVLRDKFRDMFPVFTATISSDRIDYTFAPSSYSLPALSGVHASVYMDSTKVRAGSFELDHTVYTSVFKIVVKVVLSVFAFSYCLKELRQW